MSDEKLSMGKFVGSFFEVLPWVKTLRIGLGLLGIAFVAFTIYRAFFMPTQSNKQTIHIDPGSKVTINQGIEKKRAWWIPSPFVEGYTFIESDDRKGVGGKFGARWEW